MPKLSPKKNRRAAVAMSDYDLEIAHSMARREGVTLSELIRSLVIAAALPPDPNILKTAIRVIHAPEDKRLIIMDAILKDCREKEQQAATAGKEGE